MFDIYQYKASHFYLARRPGLFIVYKYFYIYRYISVYCTNNMITYNMPQNAAAARNNSKILPARYQ